MEGKMNRQILCMELEGVVFLFLAGSLFHFLYGLSGRMKAIGLIAPVNESVWEHLKMVLWPSIIYSLFQYKLLYEHVNNFWTAKTAAICIAMLTIVLVFYLYTAFTGRSILIIDISLFAASIIIGQLVSSRIMTSTALPDTVGKLSLVFLMLIVLTFMLFTYHPPCFPIFKDPLKQGQTIRHH
jgi:hypothetical protein